MIINLLRMLLSQQTLNLTSYLIVPSPGIDFRPLVVAAAEGGIGIENPALLLEPSGMNGNAEILLESTTLALSIRPGFAVNNPCFEGTSVKKGWI